MLPAKKKKSLSTLVVLYISFKQKLYFSRLKRLKIFTDKQELISWPRIIIQKESDCNNKISNKKNQ